MYVSFQRIHVYIESDLNILGQWWLTHFMMFSQVLAELLRQFPVLLSSCTCIIMIGAKIMSKATVLNRKRPRGIEA